MVYSQLRISPPRNSRSGAQGAHQRVLHQIVGNVGVAGERARVTPQGGNHALDGIVERAHCNQLKLAGSQNMRRACFR